MNSATLIKPVLLRGRGLFSGQDSTATVKPAKAGSGLRFRCGAGDILVTADNYLEQPSCTVLAEGSYSVSVVEHLLCALWTAGIDTAIIDVDGPELPNQDGSALPLYELLLEGGREEHGPRPLLSADCDGITVEHEDSFIQLSTGETLDVHYSFCHPELGEQRFSGQVERAGAVTEILPARSFITESEAAAARGAGFLHNDNEADALIWRADHSGALQPNHHLRFDNELARHKVLDFIGDLYVLPFEWTGCVTAHRSGHRLNRQLARELLKLWRGQGRR